MKCNTSKGGLRPFRQGIHGLKGGKIIIFATLIILLEMKRIFTFIIAIAAAAAAFAQTPQEIVARMEKEIGKHGNEGVYMEMEMKIPVLGTMKAKAWMLREKSHIEARALGQDISTWNDADTQWEYDIRRKTVTIRQRDLSKREETDNREMFEGITRGYDITLVKEMPGEWHLRCMKSKSNKKKEAPKKMELVIAKGSFHPISLTARISGINVTMHDISFNVTEKDVTFDLSMFPETEIIDLR